MSYKQRLAVLFFSARQAMPLAIGIGLIFGLTVISSAEGFVTAFVTPQEKMQLVSGLGSNPGLRALLGIPDQLQTLAGFTQWRALGVVTLIGAIAGLMLSTKLLRGDEEAGRLELLLSGALTKRQLTAQVIFGCYTAILASFCLLGVLTIGIGTLQTINIPVDAALRLSLAMLASLVLFVAVGAVASQIASSQKQALALSVGLFAISFLIRALSDATSSLTLLRKLSPLGWIGQLDPLTNSQPVWYLPILLSTALLVSLAIYLAGLRDLGTGILKEAAPKPSQLTLLGSVGGLTLRLTSSSGISWAVSCAVVAAVFGSVAKSAVQSLTDSTAVHTYVTRISPDLTPGASAFLGIVNSLFMVAMMCLAAASLTGLRAQEADGYLDTLIASGVTRVRFLVGRLLVGAWTIAMVCLAIGLGTWVSVGSLGLGFSFWQIVGAGLNVAFPGLLLLGFGCFVYGLFPRALGIFSYGIILSSFLIQFLAAAIQVPNWLLDLSFLHHMALAPASDPDWWTNAGITGISLLAAVIGVYFFTQRDLIGE